MKIPEKDWGYSFNHPKLIHRHTNKFKADPFHGHTEESDVTNPILADEPWGYWPLSWGPGDASGNGRNLEVASGVLDNQEWGYYEPAGLIGTRGDVVWDTGFTPAGDYTLCAAIQRNAGGRLFFDGASAIDVAAARAQFPGGPSSWPWGYTPFDTPVILYVVVSGGTATYYWRSVDNDQIRSGSAGTPLSGPLLIGDFGRHYVYCGVAIYDHALSPWRVAVHMSGELVDG